MLNFSTYKHGNECLEIFCRTDMPLALETLKEKTGLSRRSLMYLFKHLNEELQCKGLQGITCIKGQGYLLAQTAKDFLRQHEKNKSQTISLTDTQNWHFSLRSLRENESLYLLTFVIITRQYTSLSELAEIFHGAKNTLLRLLGKLPKFLTDSGLNVQITAKGRSMTGDERTQRKWILENLEIILRICQRYSLRPETGCLEDLKAYERLSGNRFTQDTRQLLAAYLPWYAFRLHSGRLLSGTGKRGQEQEPAALWVKDFLSSLNCLTASEESYLIEVLNFFSFSKISHHAQYAKLHQIAEEMTEQFFGLSGFEPGSNHKMIMDSLTVHLLSAWQRLTAGVKYHNPMLEQIKRQYQNLFVISKAAARPFANYLGCELPEDELALLTTYFGSDIRMEELAGEKRQIMVFCSSGIGTSQFLLMQLREKYPQLLFSGPFRISDIGALTFTDAGLIITTTELGKLSPPEVPICQISPLPDKYEWEMLEQQLLSLGFSVGDYGREKIEDLLDIIANFARIENEAGLRQSLSQYFRDTGKHNSLGRYVTDTLLKYVDFYAQAPANWRQAIKLSFKPLVAHQFVENRYIKRIIELTEKQGEYMLLGRGFLLAHARPDDGVISPAASITVFAEAVPLDSGKEVRCIICLAPTDQKGHLDFLKTLLEHINLPDWCEKICAVKSPEALEALLADFFADKD